MPQQECFADIIFELSSSMSQTTLLSEESIVLPRSQTIFPVRKSRILQRFPKSLLEISEGQSLHLHGPQNPDREFVLTLNFFSNNFYFNSFSSDGDSSKFMVL